MARTLRASGFGA